MERKLNRIKTALVDQGKTNKWLAEQLGKDPATISKWCTNVSQPSLEMMMRIAKLLNVEMNDLVRLEAMPDPVVKSVKKTTVYLPVGILYENHYAFV
jgi:transcriptional regulator with XRE-family HTH domain